MKKINEIDSERERTLDEREEEEEEEEEDSRAWWDLPRYDAVFTTTVCISVSLNHFSFLFWDFYFILYLFY